MKQIGLILMAVLLMAIPVYSQKYDRVEVETVMSFNKVIYCHSTFAPNDSVVWVDFASEIHRSLDRGDSWEKITVPVSVKGTSLRPLNTDTAFFSAMYAGFYKTTDGGKTWEDMNKVDNYPNCFHFFDSNDGIMLDAKLKIPPFTISGIGDTTRIWKTFDGGYTWIEVNEPDRPAFLPGECWYHHANNMNRQTIGDTIFFGTSMGRVFRSFDRGNTWEAFFTGLGENQFIISIAHHGTKNMMVLSDGEDFGVAFKTSFTNDGGDTWTTNTLDYGCTSIAAIPGQESSFVLLKGYYDQSTGLFITHDGGNTFSKLSDIPCHTLTFVNDSVAIMPSTYIRQPGEPYTDNIYRLTFKEEIVDKVVEEKAHSRLLIFPNPANDVITIEAGSIDQYSIEITSLNGQLLYSSKMEGTSLQIDLSTFPKGAYLITVRSDDFVTTEKVVKL